MSKLFILCLKVRRIAVACNVIRRKGIEMNKLILVLLTALCFASCEREEIPFLVSYNWEGTWLAKEVVVDDTLQEIPVPSPGVYIRFTIPEDINGDMGVSTFKNWGGFDFSRLPGNRVEFGTFGGSRAQEDKWGGAVKINIRQTDNFKVEGNQLYFQDIKDNILIVLEKE